MNTTYTVKHGDTLGDIAQQHSVKPADIQALNPIISDPNYIKPGWQLEIPASAPKKALPPPMHADSLTSSAIKGQAQCEEELVDIAHITGEDHFYILTEKQSKDLKQEIKRVRTLMDELHQNLPKALPVEQCTKPQDSTASCTCTACTKDAWAIKADEAGLLEYKKPEPEAVPLTTEKDFQGQLATLQQARDWYRDYIPALWNGSRYEDNWKLMQSKKILQLDQEITRVSALVATQSKVEANAEPEDSSTNANDAAPDLKHGKGRSIESSKQTTTNRHTVEIILFSDPTQRHYITTTYRNTTPWHTHVPIQVMAGKPFNKQLGKDLIKDIKEAIGEGRKTGPLGGLELTISSWSSKEDNLLNTLHQEVSWKLDESDASPYAVGAEAQALRFAASASAGVNSWNPQEGNIDVGVKGSAAFSLAEASATMTMFFPSQGGYVASMAYRNAQGKEVLHPMGVFRLSGQLELTAFAGAKAGAQAGVQTQYKPKETPTGATSLLGAPTMEVSRSGNIGVKCEAFAGAQTGGTLIGSFKWIEPDKIGKGTSVVGQANASSNWASLADIKVEGNMAVGIGLAGEFGISIANNRLAFNCKGSLVFGPGAGGGFGTVVDLEQVGNLTLLFCNALSDMDYRQLIGVTEDAFSYMASGLFQVMTSPAQTISSAFDDEFTKMDLWWKKRQASKVEAQNLANYVLLNQTDRTMKVRDQSIPFGALPPETLGPMVYLLTESFAESFNELQEQALVILLSEIRSWRHFIKVMECCSKDLKKVDAMEGLGRINSLLDGHEQDKFNRFIDTLVINQPPARSDRDAWIPGKVWRKEKVLIAARRSGKFKGLA